MMQGLCVTDWHEFDGLCGHGLELKHLVKRNFAAKGLQSHFTTSVLPSIISLNKNMKTGLGNTNLFFITG
jgi:hypothetical protein